MRTEQDGASGGTGGQRRVGSAPMGGQKKGAPRLALPARAVEPLEPGSSALALFGSQSTGPVAVWNTPVEGPTMGTSMPPVGEESAGMRQPTLTGRIRAVRPPDVARQAIGELGVLAHELAVLPDLLERSGLAAIHRDAYLDVVRDYLTLARTAWSAVAEERLEQVGAEPAYRHHAIAIARVLTMLRRESEVALANTQFPLPPRRPGLWRQRMRLVCDGLRAWQLCLKAPADPRLLGEGVRALAGAIGLARAGAPELLLRSQLAGAARALAGLTALGLLALALGGWLSGMAKTLGAVANPVIAALTVALLAILVERTTSRGPSGAESFVGEALARKGILGGVARGWWLLAGGVTVVATLAALVGGIPAGGDQSGFLGLSADVIGTSASGGILAVLKGITDAQPTLPYLTVPEVVALFGRLIVLGAGPAAAVALVGLAVLGLPVQVAALARAGGALWDNRSWVPAARRSLVGPALTPLACATGAIFAALALLPSPALDVAVASGLPALPNGAPWLSWRAVTLAIVLLVPLVALVLLPYRAGLARWRRAWLRELTTRRADLESHIRRLSASDPESGTQDTSAENLRAMQYDMVLLQFYRTKMEEAARVPGGPLGIVGALALVAVALVASLLAGGAGAALLTALVGY